MSLKKSRIALGIIVLFTRRLTTSTRKSTRKRTIIEYDAGTSEDEDDNMIGDVTMTKSEKARAAELISGLLMSQSKKSEETTFCKKPLKQMINEDFEREQKELATKKMRMEIKILEDQSRFLV